MKYSIFSWMVAWYEVPSSSNLPITGHSSTIQRNAFHGECLQVLLHAAQSTIQTQVNMNMEVPVLHFGSAHVCCAVIIG